MVIMLLFQFIYLFIHLLIINIIYCFVLPGNNNENHRKKICVRSKYISTLFVASSLFPLSNKSFSDVSEEKCTTYHSHSLSVMILSLPSIDYDSEITLSHRNLLHARNLFWRGRYFHNIFTPRDYSLIYYGLMPAIIDKIVT